MSTDKNHPETLAVHAGREPEIGDLGLAPAIRPATTFVRGADGDYPGGHQYARSSNPGRERLERALATLEGGGEALAFASGMAAVSAVFALLKPGDHAVVSSDAYHGVIRYLDNWLKPRGIGISFCDTSNLQRTAASFTPETRLVWLESPSNPLLKICDLAAAATLARERGALSACDATFATPILQRSLDLGVDLVMHSSTKFLGGHSDLLGGVLATRNAQLAETLRSWQVDAGAVPSAFDCWLLLRSLPTLPVRMARHCASANRLAQWLNERNDVDEVFYPGLPQHPNHDVAARQMTEFGGVLSFCLAGSEHKARALASATRIFAQATSLGGVESLIEHRASIEGAQRKSPHNLLRLSVGLEHIDDLLEDLEQAFEQVKDIT